MKRKHLLLIAVLLTGAFSVGGYVVWQQRAAQAPEARYRLATIETGRVVQTVSANGTLNPVVLVNVGTQVSGTVRQLYVDFNDKVEKGQPLLELDNALLAAQARQSEANLANAKAALELATAQEARQKALLAQEYISRQEYDQAQQALKSARAQQALAQAQLDKDRVNLGNAVIRSPVSGVVVDRVVDLGQTVAASFQTPTLIKIAQDLSEMRIDTSFAEADIGSIREGQKARFTVDAFPNRQFEGAVQQIRLNPTNQQNVVTYNVRITVDNPEQVLLPGMTAYVNIAVDKRDDVLLVPNAALRFKPPELAEARPDTKENGAAAGGERSPAGEGKGKGGKRRDGGQHGTVYVLADGEIKPVSVQLGITDNRNTEVLGGGLKAGDRVLVGEQANRKAPSSVGMRLF